MIVETDGDTPTPRRLKVIVVLSPKGGAGKTAVSSTSRLALASSLPGRVVALDLDVQFGDMCASLGAPPRAHPRASSPS